MSIPESLPSAADQAYIFAENGLPVFPLYPGEKTPRIKGWQRRATTDPEQVRRWWSKWPNANIGIPTGHASGIFVLDVDLKTGGFDSILEYQDRIPHTRIIKTGGGGLQYYFLMPEGIDLRNTAGKLGDGLDTRGNGGYIVAAGSVTESPYEVFVDAPMAETPAWLIEALRNDPRRVSGHAARPNQTRAATEETGPILEGTRNRTLFELACSLRGRGLELLEIDQELHDANRTRCTTPLDSSEVAAIAQSVGRYAPGIPASSTKGTPEVRKRLAEIDRYIAGSRWSGMGEHSARDVLIALVKAARDHGEKHEQGIRVRISYRQLAERAAVSKRTAENAVRRLEDYGVLSKDVAGREAQQAGAFVLLIGGSAKVGQSVPGGGGDIESYTTAPAGRECPTLARAYSAPRLRWSVVKKERIGDHYEYFPQRRLGKVCGKIIDTLETHGPMSLEDLADEIGIKQKRDLMRRKTTPEGRDGYLTRLMDAGIVEVRGNMVVLVADWSEALELERTASGEVEAEQRQIRYHQDRREAFALELVRRKADKEDRKRRRAERRLHRRESRKSRPQVVSRT